MQTWVTLRVSWKIHCVFWDKDRQSVRQKEEKRQRDD